MTVLDVQDDFKYKAVGIVSTGFPDHERNVKCDVENYQLYTDIARYHSWIEEVVFETY